MKKMFKYLLITILTLGFIGNVNALISKDEIDFDSQVARYDEYNNTFEMVTTMTNATKKYYDVIIADNDTYSSLTAAYNAYKDNPTDSTKLELSSLLSSNSDIDESAWSDYPMEEFTPGNAYIRWMKVTNNETNSTTYSFGIYKAAGSSEDENFDYSDYEEDPSSNPDTGINPLYLIPVMVVIGSVLVFKKRRYE